MTPKSTFIVPLGDAVEVVTERRKTRRGTKTTEKKVAFQAPKGMKTSKASTSKAAVPRLPGDSAAQASNLPSDDGDELHPLYTMEDHPEEQGDDLIDFDNEEPPPPSNVCARLYYASLITHICADAYGAMASATK
jgi:hypothetical protein